MSLKDIAKLAIVGLSTLAATPAEADDIAPYKIFMKMDPSFSLVEELVSRSSCTEAGFTTGAAGQSYEVSAYLHNGNYGHNKPDNIDLSMLFVDIAEYKDASPSGCLKVTDQNLLDSFLDYNRSHFEETYGKDLVKEIEGRAAEITADLKQNGPYPFF